jgi:hypothetical protein
MLKVFENKNSILHKAIRGNAVFCDLSGLVMLVFAKPLSGFLGLNNPTILVGIGITLFVWALMLFWGSIQVEVPRWLAWLAIEGDLGWVIGTIIVILLPSLNFTTAGKWTMAIVADIVLVFAIWQFVGLRRMD